MDDHPDPMDVDAAGNDPARSHRVHDPDPWLGGVPPAQAGRSDTRPSVQHHTTQADPTSTFRIHVDPGAALAPKTRNPPPNAEDNAPILFYRRNEPYFEFTNFSHHSIDYDGKTYPTSEHLFQALKFLPARPDLAERIRTLPAPGDALREATRLQRLRRADWFDVNVGIMDTILEHKFTQHPRLRRLLLGTGTRELMENSPRDDFWGIGADGKGRNELGKALMRVRQKLGQSHL